MKNCNEMVNSLLERRDQYAVEQKRKKKTAMRLTSVACSFAFVALLGVGAWQGGFLDRTSMTGIGDSVNTDEQDYLDNLSGENPNTTHANSQEGNQSNPPVNSQLPSNTGNETPGRIPPNNSNPCAEITQRPVSYQEAKELFGYPIVECSDKNFLNYTAGLVSQNSSFRFCSEMSYNFTNDVSVFLINQERTVVYFGYEDLARKMEYNGHTFWIKNATENDQAYYIQIGYFPNQESGIGYIANVYDETIEQSEIMALILRLEIK